MSTTSATPPSPPSPSKPKIEKRTIYFTMVLDPRTGKWTRVGTPYGKKQTATGWLPVVRGSWRHCKVKVSPFTFRLIDGKLTPKAIATLDKKFNMDPPAS
jgi:hypothetical protein